MMHGPPYARTSLHRYACPTPAVSIDENAFLESWKDDIERAARFGARLLRSRAVLAEDLEQVARLRVLLVIRERAITSPRYIRRAIKHAILTAVRHELRRRDSDLRHRAE